jgi:hypothetical protein
MCSENPGRQQPSWLIAGYTDPALWDLWQRGSVAALHQRIKQLKLR